MNFARYCRLNASKYPEREFSDRKLSFKGDSSGIDLEAAQGADEQNCQLHHEGVWSQKGGCGHHLLLNSIEWYITYMAVLKTGAAISPLNFRFASADIKYACDVTKSKVFILGEMFCPG